MNEREARAADYSRRVRQKRRLLLAARLGMTLAVLAGLAWAVQVRG